MNEKNRYHAVFDERAALTELEVMQRDLEALRRRRQAAAEAFDTFIRSFGERPAAGERTGARGPAPRARTAAPVPEPAPRAASAAADSLPRSSPLAAAIDAPAGPSPDAVPQAADGVQDRAAREAPIVPAALTPPPARAGIPGTTLAGGLAALAVIGLLITLWPGREEPLHTREPAGADAPGETTRAAEVPAAASSAAGTAATPPQVADPSVPSSSGATEIVTLRRVWMRVTVDGQRVLERELDPGLRIPLRAEETIVIRAGDGGAARLFLRGKDQGILGRDGQVVTRAFTVR